MRPHLQAAEYLSLIRWSGARPDGILAAVDNVLGRRRRRQIPSKNLGLSALLRELILGQISFGVMLPGMNARKLHKPKNEMQAFVEDVAAGIGRSERKHWCSTYLRGLLLDGDGKSIEPMAGRLTAMDQPEKDYVQALQQFITRATGRTRWFRKTCGDVSAASSAQKAC